VRRIMTAVGAALAVACVCAGLSFAQPRGPFGTPGLNPLPPQEEPPPLPFGIPPGFPFGPPPEPEPEAVFRVDIQPLNEGEEVDADAPPAARPRFPIATFQVVDKLTAESARFDVRLDNPVQYESLIFTLRACEGAAPDELVRDFAAHVQVDFRPPAPNGRSNTQTIYRGWMYASSPSVSPLKHSIYDAWLISCKADAPPGG
jgi:hypothetical protein